MITDLDTGAVLLMAALGLSAVLLIGVAVVGLVLKIHERRFDENQD